MIKYLFSLLVVISSIHSQAQISDSSKYIGGSLGYFQSSKNRDFLISDNIERSQEKSFVISPKIGFFLNKNISLGIQLSYSYYQNEFTVRNRLNPFAVSYDDRLNSNLTTLSIPARFYKSLSKSFYLYIETSLSAGVGKIKFGTNQGLEADVLEYSILARPGGILFINDNLGLEAFIGQLGYKASKMTRETEDFTQENTENSFGLEGGLETLQLGILYYY